MERREKERAKRVSDCQRGSSGEELGGASLAGQQWRARRDSGGELGGGELDPINQVSFAHSLFEFHSLNRLCGVDVQIIVVVLC
ncbi:hypothetical protein Syun_012335 [Stephania yunnanensis]|uniref:Uncharacterized protein n=1 Tax=Stephania yunnanensis TaxID=152371 RepID=A0AAP0K1H8_9MAGN